MHTLTHTEADALSFFHMTPDLVCIASKEGYFKKVNKSVLEKLEYSETELFSRPIKDFQHPDDQPPTAQTRAELLEGKHLVNFQNRYISKSGKVIWLEWTSIYVPDKEIVFAIAKDITSRKLIDLETEQKYLKFKNLATHFKTKIEKDRKYFAVELHEELAQLAAVIKQDMDWLGSNTPELNGFAKERVTHAVTVSGMMITTIRRIAFSVSPNILSDLGLNETLVWMCDEFSAINHIPCEFEAAYDEQRVSPEIRMDFFRICQEAMNNIIRHAAAKRVNVCIREDNSFVYLVISDDGKGFDVLSTPAGSGITGMQELASSVNGVLEIHSIPGEGTIVSAKVPL
ncbi:MAG: domain S-box-containing protein [Ferruginibacter sp.]|nr:domain S-box-containing protein [Ferruginibacter sp.]